MNKREKAKAMMLKTNPNFCNDLRAVENGEFKNHTDEECLDWWALGIEEVIKKAESK